MMVVTMMLLLLVVMMMVVDRPSSPLACFHAALRHPHSQPV